MADTPAVTAIAWSNSLPVSVTDPCGRVTAFSYDAQGFISGVVPQAGPAVSFENDSLGNRCRIIMPSSDSSSNRVTIVESDEIGRNSTVTYPDGLVETLRHDACGNPTSHVSRAGRRTDLTWLPSAHVGSVKRWLDPATPVAVSYDYDLLFRTMAVTDPLGREVERYVLDDEDLVTAATILKAKSFRRCTARAGCRSR
jgi:YD repeat-containing protein